MKRIFLIALLLVCAGMLSGCHADGKLYPVQGPLASQKPTPAFAIRFTGGISKSGGISATLANGEVAKGAWTEITDSPATGAGAANPGSSAAPSLSAAWDTVFGSGYYTAHVLGRRDVIRGTLTGDHGTTLTVEAYQSAPNPQPNTAAAAIRGVATDSDGNVYKLTF